MLHTVPGRQPGHELQFLQIYMPWWEACHGEVLSLSKTRGNPCVLHMPTPHPSSCGLARPFDITGEIHFQNSPASASDQCQCSICPYMLTLSSLRPHSANSPHEKGRKKRKWFTNSEANNLQKKHTGNSIVMIETVKNSKLNKLQYFYSLHDMTNVYKNQYNLSNIQVCHILIII